MRIPKRYGQSKKDVCPFCGSNAVTSNPQGIPVCIKHKQDSLDVKCACGSWLDARTGKFGPYFNCINCGNLSFSKGLSMDVKIQGDSDETKGKGKADNFSSKTKQKDTFKSKIKNPKEITITSDDLDYF